MLMSILVLLQATRHTANQHAAGMLLVLLLSRASGAPATASCAGWCTRKPGESQTHCAHADCAGCAACMNVARCEPNGPDDLAHESCEPWCQGQHDAVHCTKCSCKSCLFCSVTARPAVPAASAAHSATVSASAPGAVGASAPGAAAAAAGASASPSELSSAPPSVLAVAKGTACTPLNSEDVDHMDCAQWCKAQHWSTHGKFCACKACVFDKSHPALAAQAAARSEVPCTPHSPEDANVATCERFCNERHLASHCPTCRCTSCGFCSAFNAKRQADAALERAAADTLAAEKAAAAEKASAEKAAADKAKMASRNKAKREKAAAEKKAAATSGTVPSPGTVPGPSPDATRPSASGASAGSSSPGSGAGGPQPAPGPVFRPASPQAGSSGSAAGASAPSLLSGLPGGSQSYVVIGAAAFLGVLLAVLIGVACLQRSRRDPHGRCAARGEQGRG